MIARIKNKINRELLNLKFKTGIYKLFPKGSNKIIMYHGVAKKDNNSMNFRHISAEVFEKHLKFLKKNTHVISVEDFFEQKFIKGKPNVAITFDDGYLNNYQHAFPLIEKYEAPTTFYITGLNTTSHHILWPDFHDLMVSVCQESEITCNGLTFLRNGRDIKRPYISKTDNENFHEYLKKLAFKDKMEVLDKYTKGTDILNKETHFDYWKLASDEQIIEMSKGKYTTIGSHGMLHNNLGLINIQEAEQELINSKNYLEALTQKEINSIAYPDGSYTRAVVEIAKNLGFKYQLAVNYLFSEDKKDNVILDRIGLYSYETLPMQYQNFLK
jgi:peptidoglycan/xylan/chitin deacetylase (PgdA/CDA1 family)